MSPDGFIGEEFFPLLEALTSTVVEGVLDPFIGVERTAETIGVVVVAEVVADALGLKPPGVVGALFPPTFVQETPLPFAGFKRRGA